jgi:hypothetical protein
MCPPESVGVRRFPSSVAVLFCCTDADTPTGVPALVDRGSNIVHRGIIGECSVECDAGKRTVADLLVPQPPMGL